MTVDSGHVRTVVENRFLSLRRKIPSRPVLMTCEPPGRLCRSWGDNAAGRCAGYGCAPRNQGVIGGDQCLSWHRVSTRSR